MHDELIGRLGLLTYFSEVSFVGGPCQFIATQLVYSSLILSLVPFQTSAENWTKSRRGYFFGLHQYFTRELEDIPEPIWNETYGAYPPIWAHMTEISLFVLITRIL